MAVIYSLALLLEPFNAQVQLTTIQVIRLFFTNTFRQYFSVESCQKRKTLETKSN